MTDKTITFPLIIKNLNQPETSSKHVHRVLLFFSFFLFVSFLNADVVHALKTVRNDFTNNAGSKPAVSLTTEERAWLKAHPDIQIGYTDSFEPEVIVNPDGSYRGILVDILAELNSRLGTRIHLRIDPIPELLEKMEEKKIDGIFNLHPDYAEELGLLKTRDYFTEYPAVFARRDVSFNRPSDLAGRKVAVIDKVFFSRPIIEQYGMRATVLKVQNAEEGLRSVQSGQVDYFLGATLNAYLITKYQLVDVVTRYVFRDLPVTTVIATRSDWPELSSILDKGLSSFTKEELEAITAKWVHLPQQKKVIELTKEERAWLKSHPIIRFSGDPAYLPLEAFSTDGKYIGIFADILDLMESRLDLRFERVPVSTWREAVRMAEAGEVDFLSESIQSGRDKLFTNPHSEIPVVIIGRKGTPTLSSPAELSGRKVALVKGYTVHNPFREAHPDIDFVEVESTRAGLLMVTTGAIDAFISTPLTASYLMSEMGIENLSIIGYTGAIIKLGFGVRKDAPQLVSILNKALNTITEQEKLAFRDKWSANKLKRSPVQLTARDQTWLDAHPVITLGGGIFPPLDDYNEVKGRPEGIGPDYTELIGDLLGIKFKYISDDWAKILKMAEEKKIDGIRIMLRNKEREAYLNFTQSQTSIQYAIFVQKHSGQPRTLKDLSRKKVGVMGDTYSHSYLRERHPDIEVVPFKRIDDALFALIGGELDAVVASLTVAGIAADRLFITSLKVAATVPEMDTRLQIGVRKDWPEFVTILNKAINAITPEQHREIKRRWITFDPEDLIEPLKLSEKEKNWLAQGHTVRVRVANAEPYIFVRDGKPQGITVDLLDLIHQHTGVKFRYIMDSPSFAEDLENIAQHEGPDLISTIMKTPERETFLLFTKNYSISPRFIFTRQDSEFIRGMDDLSDKTVAVVNSFAVHEYLKKNHPEINLLVYRNIEDSLKAVSSGKAFAFIGDLKFAPIMIIRLGLHNLKVAAPSSLPDHVQAMATRNDWPELRDIINKALDVIPPEEKTAIINKWSSVKFDYGVRPVDVLKWGLGFGGGAFLIVFLFVFWNKSLKKQVDVRTKELDSINKSLEAEIIERRQKEQQLEAYKDRLKALASQLTLAEEQERRHIAADLHDLIGHSLALARLQLAALSDAQSKTETAVLVADVSSILLKAIQDTKNLMFELSSPSLNEIGLGAAVSEWVEEYVGRRYGLKTELTDRIDDAMRKTLDESVRAILFRNVRELLTNVIKHAQAKKLRVFLENTKETVKVTVTDDGIGFNPEDIGEVNQESKFGLFSIKERMTDLGGTFEIVSKPGQGCRAILTVPITLTPEPSRSVET